MLTDVVLLKDVQVVSRSAVNRTASGILDPLEKKIEEKRNRRKNKNRREKKTPSEKHLLTLVLLCVVCGMYHGQRYCCRTVLYLPSRVCGVKVTDVTVRILKPCVS